MHWWKHLYNFLTAFSILTRYVLYKFFHPCFGFLPIPPPSVLYNHFFRCPSVPPHCSTSGRPLAINAVLLVMSNFWVQSPTPIPRGLRANEACIRNAVGNPHQRTGKKEISTILFSICRFVACKSTVWLHCPFSFFRLEDKFFV